MKKGLNNFNTRSTVKSMSFQDFTLFSCLFSVYICDIIIIDPGTMKLKAL
jgi:hypothetical protein